MMVHTWDTVLAVVKVVDHETGQEHFLDPEVLSLDRCIFIYSAVTEVLVMVYHFVNVSLNNSK
jgi:hypothetical protein